MALTLISNTQKDILIEKPIMIFLLTIKEGDLTKQGGHKVHNTLYLTVVTATKRLRGKGFINEKD